MRSFLRIAAVGVVLFATSTAFSQTISLHPRVFNDIPTAAFAGVIGPDFALLSERGVSAPTGFANRDDWLFDTPINNTDYWTLETTVTLVGSPTTPRKEAGLRVNSGIGGDGQFIVNTDAHEIVAFGGPFPFFAFPSAYVSGMPIHMSMQYTNVGGLNGIIYGANGTYSPFLPMTNLEQGIIDGSTLGGYFQIVNDPSNAQNGGDAIFTDIRINGQRPGVIPEPASLMLLGTGLLSLLGMRRRK